MDLKSKLSNLKNKTDISNLSTLDLLKIGTPTIKDDVPSQTLPDVIQQEPTDEILIPTSVGDVVSNQKAAKQVQQEITKIEEEIHEDLNIKRTSFSLNSLKSNVLSLLKKDEDTKQKAKEQEVGYVENTEQQIQQTEPQQVSFQQVTEQLTQQIGENVVKETLEEVEKEIKAKYKRKTNIEIPEEVKITEVIEEIQSALEDIPDADDNLSLTDFEIVNTKSKEGYTKTVVGFKKGTPKEISEIATHARKVSGNVIQPRTMNILNIQNINKTQLKNSSVKLPMRSYTFKPDHTKLKVSKFNRFIISIHEDFASTKEIYIYLQESRTKFITKTTCDIEFLGKLIYSFYTEGIEITKRKIQFKDTQNPLLRLVPTIVKSRQFKVKPLKVDEETQSVKALKIKGTNGVNTWLSVLIHENNGMSGLYDVYAVADFDESWKIKINSGFKKGGHPLDMAYLQSDGFNDTLFKFFQNDPSKFKSTGLDFDDTDTKYTMLLANLKHRNLRKVYIEMLDHIESDENVEEVDIVKTYSQLETKQIMELEKQDDYNAEVIVGKSKNIEYFILSYFAMLIEGGDKRAGRDYITTDDYYEKYNVKDKRKYEERVRTILTKEEKQRNYNARPYMFKIEYKIGGKEKEMISSTFEEINSKLNIF